MNTSEMNNKIVEGFWSLYHQYIAIRKSRYDPNRSRNRHDSLLKILSFVKAVPEARVELAACFIKLVEDIHDYQSDVSYGWAVIPFCMRELQWPEVKESLERELKKTDDPEIVLYLKRIRSAYEPIWKDESSFLYYVEKAKREGRSLN